MNSVYKTTVRAITYMLRCVHTLQTGVRVHNGARTGTGARHDMFNFQRSMLDKISCHYTHENLN